MMLQPEGMWDKHEKDGMPAKWLERMGKDGINDTHSASEKIVNEVDDTVRGNKSLTFDRGHNYPQ